MTESQTFQEGECLFFYDRPLAFEVSSGGKNGLAYVYDDEPDDQLAVALAEEHIWNRWKKDEIDFRGLMCHETTVRFLCTTDDWIAAGTFRAHPLPRPFKSSEILKAGKFCNHPW